MNDKDYPFSFRGVVEMIVIAMLMTIAIDTSARIGHWIAGDVGAYYGIWVLALIVVAAIFVWINPIGIFWASFKLIFLRPEKCPVCQLKACNGSEGGNCDS